MREEIIKENCFIGWYVFVGGGGVNSNNTKNKVDLKIYAKHLLNFRSS